MSGEMKLSYFNVRGRGEGARILLKLAGKEFVDNRIGGEDWQKFKPSKWNPSVLYWYVRNHKIIYTYT